MARPKRVDGEPTAKQRMEDAFWDMLADIPYHKMASREICKRAGVSHNAFYYHFENLNDMAHQLLDGLFIPELPLSLLSIVDGDLTSTQGIEAIPDLPSRLSKMRLLASSGSPELAGLVSDEVLKAWLRAIGTDESELSDEDYIDLTFIIGGIMALLGSGIVPSESAALASFAEREVGQGVIRKMAGLSSSNR